MSVKDDLIAARALIDAPEKWGKGDGIDAPPGELLCAMNANCAVTKTWHRKDAVDTALIVEMPSGDWDDAQLPLAAYNDHPDTTHADIIALFDRAIANCEALK